MTANIELQLPPLGYRESAYIPYCLHISNFLELPIETDFEIHLNLCTHHHTYCNHRYCASDLVNLPLVLLELEETAF